MNRHIIYACALAAALFAGPAFALQNVANTSQKGSLQIFPLITVDTTDSSNTLIELSNGEITKVHVECSYINEKKGRVDFDFFLTPKATASWEVLGGSGTISAPLFPKGGAYSPGNPTRGELVCFAVDAGGANQIAFNHLSGTATVVNLGGTKEALRYNSWSFLARNAIGMPEADNVIQGTAGTLLLTGGLAGTYDACPLTNIGLFNPRGATEGGVTTTDNSLSVVSCNQDLRQDYVLNTTKLQFTVWNANENSFTGSYDCVDSVTTAPLSAADATTVTNPSNFDFSTLRTANARFEVQGVASTQCPTGTSASGLLGVVTSVVNLGGTTAVTLQEIGSTTQGAGQESGFVLWDPAGSVPFGNRK